MTDQDLADAVAALKAGQVIGLPTETVYGLAGDAASRTAVAAIFRIKGRPADHPLIVHVVDQAQALHWVRWNPMADRLARAFWPGPLTMLLPRQPQAPAWAAAGRDSFGIRCPSHPVAQRLLRAALAAGIDGLAAPSANRFGRISPTHAAHVREEFGQAVPVILDAGSSEIGIESTIVDLTGVVPVIRRPGRIRADAIERALGIVIGLRDGHPGVDAATVGGEPAPNRDEMQTVSGELPAHYAPRTPMRLVPPSLLDAEVRGRAEAGQRVVVWSTQVPAAAAVHRAAVTWHAMPDQVEAVERALYAKLRELDASGAGAIVIEAPPSEPAWAAVNDRLGRAQTGSGQMVTEQTVTERADRQGRRHSHPP